MFGELDGTTRKQIESEVQRYLTEEDARRKNEIDGEVSRVFREDAGKHRTHLETLFRRLMWALGVLAIAGIGLFYWFFGNTRREMQDYVTRSVKTRFLDYEFDDEVIVTLEGRIASVADKRAKSKETQKIIDGFIQARVKTYLESEAIPVLRAATNQRIEQIGTWDPSQVFAVPAGSIVPYGGSILEQDDVPDGWLLCDGSVIPDGEHYGALRELLRSTAWGNTGAQVRLPDLRGMFLRGVDDPDGPAGTEWDPAGRDPDADERKHPTLDQFSQLIGSVQDYATALPRVDFWANLRHRHGYRRAVRGDVRAGGTEDPRNNDGSTNTDPALSEAQVTNEGGGDTETRPKNAYVNFIIKY